MNDRKALKIITQEEFKAIFVNNWRRVWNNDLLLCTTNKIAALTGMRCSEVLGLRGEYVYDDHIFLCGQYDEYGYRETKTKIKHHIPLTSEVIADLRKLKKLNGEGFLFSLDGGATPMCRNTMYKDFHKALRNIKIIDDEISDRHLHLHGWRHFFNTELLKSGLTIPQTQAVTAMSPILGSLISLGSTPHTAPLSESTSIQLLAIASCPARFPCGLLSF
jgi:integrase